MREAVELLARQWVVVLATVVARRGSTPSTPGQKLLLSSPAVTSASAALAVGTIGGGAIELRVLARMRQMLGGPPSPPGIETFDLGSALGMCCGGSVDVLFERLEPALSVLVVGAGHIGASLAPLCAGLGFRTVVCDQREGAAERVVGREGVQASGRPVVVLPLEHDDPEVLDAVGDPVAAAALVMTHDHQLDQAAIEWALARRFAFVGGVGSRAKAARTQARLEAKGVATIDIERVRMPLGVVVGARAPLEIAVAIAAELVAWRAERHGSARVRAPLAGSRTGDAPVVRFASARPGPAGAPGPTLPGVGADSERAAAKTRFLSGVRGPEGEDEAG